MKNLDEFQGKNVRGIPRGIIERISGEILEAISKRTNFREIDKVIPGRSPRRIKEILKQQCYNQKD